MSDYSFRLTSRTAIEYVDEHGISQRVQLSRNQPFLEHTITEPCAALRFVEAAQSRGIPVQSDASEVIARACADCSSATSPFCSRPPQPEAIPPIQIEASPPPPSLERRPPGGDDTRESLGAVRPPTDSLQAASPRRSGPPLVDNRPPSQQYHEPWNSDPENFLEDLLSQSPSRMSREAIVRNEALPHAPHHDHSRPQAAAQEQQADPVLLFSGQYELVQEDVRVADASIEIVLERLYRSGAVYFGPWGYNWDHNYNVYLRELDGGKVAVWAGRLSELVYTPYEDRLESPAGVFARLARADSNWTLEWKGGLRWTFARPEGWPRPEIIPLITIEDMLGNRLSLSYGPEGRLRTVLDEAGRGLTFGYGACGLLETVSDSYGRIWRYLHAEEIEHLVAVITPAVEDSPTGYVTRFEYDTDQFHPALKHNLIRVIDPTGRVMVENEYGVDPSGADWNRVVRQSYAGAESFFESEGLQWVPDLPSEMNTPFRQVQAIEGGVRKVYTFNYRGNLLDLRYRLVHDGTYRLVVHQIRYDGQGNPVEERSPDGSGVSRSFDWSNRDPRMRGNLLEETAVASTLRPAPPRTLRRMTYESRFGRLKQVIDEAGATTRWTFDYEIGAGSCGLPVRVDHPPVTLPDGSRQLATESWSWGVGGRLEQHTDAEGNTTTHEYFRDGPHAGRVSRLIDATGTTDFEYDRRGALNLITRDGVLIESTLYNALGQMSEHRGRGGSMRWTYGPAGIPIHVWTPRGEYTDAVIEGDWIRHDFEYDDAGRIRSETAFANTERPAITRSRQSATGVLLEQEDALGRRTRTLYNEENQPLRRTYLAGTEAEFNESWAYDTCGRLLSYTDPEGLQTDIQYDTWGRIERVSAPGEEPRTTELRRYSSENRISRMEIIGRDSDETVHTLRWVERDYDERGRVVRVRTEGSERLRWHDRSGRLVRVEQVGHAMVQHYQFDHRSLLTEAADGAGNQARLIYNSIGELIRIEETEAGVAGLRVTMIAYDADGNIASVLSGAGSLTTFRYDSRGLPILRMTSDGAVLVWAYDEAGRLLRSEVTGPGLGSPVTHGWSYDIGGRLLSYTNPEGARWALRYGLSDHWLATIWPDGSAHTRVVEAWGRVQAERRRDGLIASAMYSADGTLRRVDWAGSSAVEPLEFRRDGLHRLTAVRQGTAEHRWEYDNLDRVTQERSGSEEFRWMDAGRGEVRLVYPGGLEVVHSHDSSARLQGIRVRGSEIVRYEYEGIQVHRCILSNGNVVEYTYDHARRPVAIVTRSRRDEELFRLEYLYDAMSRITAERMQSSEPLVRLYEYDALGRLIAANTLRRAASIAALTAEESARILRELQFISPERREEWQWSTADSLIRSRVNGTERLVENRPGGQIVAVEQDGLRIAFSHEAGGRRSDDGQRQYERDRMGRIIRIRQVGGPVVDLRYDILGRLRGMRDDAGRDTQFRWWSGSCLEIIEGGSVNSRVPGAELYHYPAEVTRDGLRWRHQDLRASLVGMSNESGSVIARSSYTPFGHASSPAAEFASYRVLLPDLHYAGTRLYDSSLGMFLEPDLEGLSGSSNVYSYAGGDPINRWDPDGRIAPFLIVGAVVGLIAAAAYIVQDAEAHPQNYPTSDLTSTFSWTHARITGIGLAGAAVGAAAAGLEEVILGYCGLGSLATGEAALLARGASYGQQLLWRAGASATAGYYTTQGFHGLLPNTVAPADLSTVVVAGAVGASGPGAAQFFSDTSRYLTRPLVFAFNPILFSLRRRADRLATQLVNTAFDPFTSYSHLRPGNLPRSVGGTTEVMTGRITVSTETIFQSRFGIGEVREHARAMLRHEVGHHWLSGRPTNRARSFSERASTWARNRFAAMRLSAIRNSRALAFVDEAFAEGVAHGRWQAGLDYASRVGTTQTDLTLRSRWVGGALSEGLTRNFLETTRNFLNLKGGRGD